MTADSTATDRRRAVGNIAGWIIAALLTLIAVYLHGILLQSAGPLWRDEINTFNFAILPWSQLWPMLDYDSFPLAGPLLLRGWASIGLAESPISVRLFGSIVGLAILATLWLHAWRTFRGPPLVSLALFGLSVVTIRYGDSIRSYGVGLLFILLAYIAIAELLVKVTLARVLFAALASVLAVQCLYQNAIVLLAIGLAGARVAWDGNKRINAITILSVGALAAVSLLPYLGPLRRAGKWSDMVTGRVSSSMITQQISETLTEPNGVVFAAWTAGTLLAVVASAIYYIQDRRKKPHQPANSVSQPDIGEAGDSSLDATATSIRTSLTFSIQATVFTWVLTIGLCWIGGFVPRPWYLMSVFAMTALFCDAALAAPNISGSWSIAIRSLLALVISVTTLWNAQGYLRLPATNLAQVAGLLKERASPDDYVVVLPWYYGVGWQQYYTGAAPWTTMPPMSELTIHRYDLLKKELEAGASPDDIFQEIKKTLSAGNTVWVVGSIWPPNVPPPAHVIAEDPSTLPLRRLLDRRYIELSIFLSRHVTSLEEPLSQLPKVKPTWGDFVNLYQFEGWRKSPWRPLLQGQ